MFEYELDHIKNEEIKKFTELVLSKISPEVWHKPASSTGKYHSAQGQGYDGLYTHSRLTVFWELSLPKFSC